MKWHCDGAVLESFFCLLPKVVLAMSLTREPHREDLGECTDRLKSPPSFVLLCDHWSSYTSLRPYTKNQLYVKFTLYEGWNFNSGNYLFTNDTK